MTNENKTIIDKKAEGDFVLADNAITSAEPVTDAAQDIALPSLQKRAMWYDALMIMLLFLVAQIAVAIAVTVIGFEPPTTEQLTHEMADVREVALQDMAKYMATNFFCAMFASVVFIIIYLKLRCIKLRVKFFSKGWALPHRLLVGYLLLWCVSIASEPLVEMLPSQSPILGTGLWLLMMTVVFAPFFEELLFRGYLLGAIRGRYGAVAAWLLSSVLFGAVHGSVATLVSASLSGLILGYYYIRYGSLVQTIILHSMNNLTVCFMMSVGVADMSVGELVANDRIYWTIYAVAATVSVVAFAVMIIRLLRVKHTNISAKQ